MDNSEAIRHLRALKERGRQYLVRGISTPQMEGEIEALGRAIRALQDQEDRAAND